MTKAGWDNVISQLALSKKSKTKVPLPAVGVTNSSNWTSAFDRVRSSRNSHAAHQYDTQGDCHAEDAAEYRPDLPDVIYSTQAEVLDLLSHARLAGQSTRAVLSTCTDDSVVFVAHLGLGAFCSVDLVAVHTADGRPPVLAAAKTCTLAQGDPNQRAIAKESEVLERTAGSPFIMQLYKVLVTQHAPAGQLEGQTSDAEQLLSETGELTSMGSLRALPPHRHVRGRASLDGLGGSSMRTCQDGAGHMQPLASPGGGRRSMDWGQAGTGMCHMSMGADTHGAALGAGMGSGGKFRLPSHLPCTTTTLLLSWAQGGDVKGLVKHLLLHPERQHMRHGHHHHGHSHGHHRSSASGTHAHGAHPHDQLLLSEATLRFYAGCLLLALEHLHRQHLIHRDLKLANLLLLSNGYLQLGDLGTITEVPPGTRIAGRVGSPGYMAPEVMWREPYDLSADVWSVGACIYNMATGFLPASTSGPPDKSWQPHLCAFMSTQLHDLLSRLLSTNPHKRPLISELFSDPWFKPLDWRALASMSLPAPSDVPWQEMLWKPKSNFARTHLTLHQPSGQH